MHYIRLLRAPKLASPGGSQQVQVELVFTITTDLGDSFLLLSRPSPIIATAHISTPDETSMILLSHPGLIEWKPHARIAKPIVQIPPKVVNASLAGKSVLIKLSLTLSQSADDVDGILTAASNTPNQDGDHGLIMPAWVSFQLTKKGTHLHLNHQETSIRSLLLNKDPTTRRATFIRIEEEIGESIAKHVWDAGVVALTAIAGTHAYPEHDISKANCMQAMLQKLSGDDSLNILELGCGVGILSIGIAAMLPHWRQAYSNEEKRQRCNILLTDLSDAKERAERNIEHLNDPDMDEEHYDSFLDISFEVLDWDESKQGRFGPQARSKKWDLIILSDCTYNVDMIPALVGSLSALHRHNVIVSPGAGSPKSPVESSVFIATKPRHASEKILFDVMKNEDWEIKESQIVALPSAGAEEEQVEFYLFQKS